MDWRSVKFDWNRARAFLVTVEEGSLSAAARALGMAQPTLGRQVAALEEELGVALFERSGRGLELTPTGLDLVAHVREMGAAATRVSLAATGQSQSVEGSVCITASELYSCHLLPPILARLRREHPGIEVEVVAANDIRDLKRREADIAIRNARPVQNDLIARKVADDSAGLYAARDYVAEAGPFGDTASLAGAAFVGFDQVDVLLEGLRALGLSLERANFRLLTGSHVAQWAMVKAGLGIGVVPLWVGDAEPAVERVLPDMPPITFPIWLAAHREVATSRRIRIVFDLLAEEIRHLPQPATETAPT